MLQCHHLSSLLHLLPLSRHSPTPPPSLSLPFLIRPTHTLSPSAPPPPRANPGPTQWLVSQLTEPVTPPQDTGDSGPIELYPPPPSIFATSDDPSPIQVATSLLLTGAISVFLFRSLRRRARRAKELKFRSSGTEKTLKEEALASLKAMESAPIEGQKPPSPVQALLGAISAGVIALILYKFTTTIEASLNRQTMSDNFSVRQITITIRTIVNGLCYLATFVFGINSVGLLLYSAQLAFNSFMDETETNATEQSGKSDANGNQRRHLLAGGIKTLRLMLSNSEVENLKMGSIEQQQQQQKKKTKTKKKTPKELLPLNPNWAKLQQKLQTLGPIPTSKTEATESSVLGKRKERSNAESNDSPINPLTPTNDDFSLTDTVAMDCEMVGVGQGNRSALGRVTLVNQWGNVIYNEFVRPIEHVVDFRTHISGIRPRDLRKAKDFSTVQRKVAELIKGRILVGHALSNDFKALLLSHPKKDIRDTVEYHPFLNGQRRRSLKHLAAEFLGVKIQNGEHCSIEDARAAMLLYQRNKREWEKNIKDQMRLKERQKRKQKKKAKETGALNVRDGAIAS